MMAARFSEVFSKKGLTRQKAVDLLKKQLPLGEFYGSTHVSEDFDAQAFPGVTEYGKAFIAKSEVDEISKMALVCAKTEGIDEFWLDVKRSGEHTFTSLDISKEVGKFLENEGLRVKKGGKLIRIDVRGEKTLVFVPKKGPGGLPMGLFGKAVFIWDGGYKSQVALVRLASRGYLPKVLVEEGKPAIGDIIRLDLSEVHDTVSHSLEGLKGPLIKLFKYMLAKEVKGQFIATGEILGSDISEDPQLLKQIERIAEVEIVRPIGFFNQSLVREEAQHFGFPIEEHHKDWKRFRIKELETEWDALELKKILTRVKKQITS